MKKINQFILPVFLTVVFSGCNKYLDKLDNPNLVTDPPLNGLLANATYETGLNMYRMGTITSYYMQYLASDSKSSDKDIYNETDYSGTWTSYYETMMNIKQMIDRGQTSGALLHVGIGKILMALNLNMLINTFGDVPYSTALKGKAQFIPTFDSQANLYDTALALLDEGISDMGQTDVTLLVDPASDVIHGGSSDAWIKTAHALKARFLNQLTKKSTYDPQAVLTELEDAYTSNTDDATLTVFFGRSPWNSVAYDNANNSLGGWLSTQFVNALNGTTFGVVDPRLALIASLTKFNDYRGTVNGKGRIGTGTNKEESYLSVDGYYSKGGAPLMISTYSEMKFIMAEAALRANDPASAYTAYLAGITANMNKVGVDSVAREAYLSNPSVGVGASNLTLKLIFKEKYVATFLNPEAWVDGRRNDYDYDGFALPQNAVLTDFIQRLGYPTVEISRNGANIPTVSGLDEKLFFNTN